MSDTRPTLIERYCMSLTKIAQACTPSMKMLSESAVNFMERRSNMKDFDYNAAKAGAPVCTRDEREVRIVCFDAKGDNYPILALITQEGGAEIHQWYDVNGRINKRIDDERDLFMATTKREGWINIYKRVGRIVTGDCVWNTEDEAKSVVVKEDYITTIKIEWEE